MKTEGQNGYVLDGYGVDTALCGRHGGIVNERRKTTYATRTTTYATNATNAACTTCTTG